MAVALCAGPSAAQAQVGERSIPSFTYHAAFSHLHDGDYNDALEVFRDEGRGAIKTPQARWIDSICYDAMAGECYYQMGRLGEALDYYTAAVELYVAFSRLDDAGAVSADDSRLEFAWFGSLGAPARRRARWDSIPTRR